MEEGDAGDGGCLQSCSLSLRSGLNSDYTDDERLRPQTYKELYNLQHSVLRSGAAECGFGILKKVRGRYSAMQRPWQRLAMRLCA